jgi:hypothetical protein
MGVQAIADGEDVYAGRADDIPLTTRVARNVAVAVVGGNLGYVQIAEHLGVVPTVLTRRVQLTNEWRVSELDRIGRLLGLAPCVWMAESTASVARRMAAKRMAVRACFVENPNPSGEVLREWLTMVYSEAYADLVLGVSAAVGEQVAASA